MQEVTWNTGGFKRIHCTLQLILAMRYSEFSVAATITEPNRHAHIAAISGANIIFPISFLTTYSIPSMSEDPKLTKSCPDQLEMKGNYFCRCATVVDTQQQRSIGPNIVGINPGKA